MYCAEFDIICSLPGIIIRVIMMKYEDPNMEAYWNNQQRLMTNAYYPFDLESEEAIYRKCY